MAEIHFDTLQEQPISILVSEHSEGFTDTLQDDSTANKRFNILVKEQRIRKLGASASG